MKILSRRAILLGAGAVIGAAATRSVHKALPTSDGVLIDETITQQGFLNDASELSLTPIHKHHIINDADDQLVARLRSEIKSARNEGRPVNVGAARHSMGAKAIPRNGHAFTFDNGSIEIDAVAQTYRAHAGARWSQVISALDPVGLSPKVMQSNNDFGVAATFSVNAHGWPAPLGPMGSTVKSIRMVLANGELVNCSRDENVELFNLAMGGYGLIGAIIDLELEAAPNVNLVPNFEKMPATEFGAAFETALSDQAVTMAYGRLNVARANFLEEAQLTTYRAAEDQSHIQPATGSGAMAKLGSYIYRAQLGNEAAKRRRWWIESSLGPKFMGGVATRNSLMNEPVVTLEDRNQRRTDILHEYFVPVGQFNDFLEVCRSVIPNSYQEFLNVTLRYVAQDDESVLSYATTNRIAAVMSFTQEKSPRGESDMKRMTQDLIEGIIGIGGTYYLPYRLHAGQDQFTRAYRRADFFAQEKRKIDPQLIFRNGLWDQYMEVL